jgi:hypothetical protein
MVLRPRSTLKSRSLSSSKCSNIQIVREVKISSNKTSSWQEVARMIFKASSYMSVTLSLVRQVTLFGAERMLTTQVTMFLTPGLEISGSNSMTTLSHLHQNRKFSTSRRFSYFMSFNHWHESLGCSAKSHLISGHLIFYEERQKFSRDWYILLFNEFQLLA